jgi:hypothetical protein
MLFWSSIFICLKLLWMVLFSWFLSQIIHRVCVEMLLIFVYRFLYHATFLNVFMRSKSFLVEFLGSFPYKIKSSANRNNLSFSFPIWIPWGFFFSFFLSSALLLAQSKRSPTLSSLIRGKFGGNSQHSHQSLPTPCHFCWIKWQDSVKKTALTFCLSFCLVYGSHCERCFRYFAIRTKGLKAQAETDETEE